MKVLSGLCLSLSSEQLGLVCDLWLNRGDELGRRVLFGFLEGMGGRLPGFGDGCTEPLLLLFHLGLRSSLLS